MPKINLPPPPSIGMPLVSALAARRSAATFSPAPLRLEALSALLAHGVKTRSDHRRPYPSGGGLYPIETYFLSFNTAGLPCGAFHYDPEGHALRHLWDLNPDDTSASFVFAEAELQQFAGMFVFTAVWERSAQKYRDFAYHLGHLEAGHLCENLCLLAAALDVGVRPFAGFNDRHIVETLDLNMKREQPIYSMLLGNTAKL